MSHNKQIALAAFASIIMIAFVALMLHQEETWKSNFASDKCEERRLLLECLAAVPPNSKASKYGIVSDCTTYVEKPINEIKPECR